MNNTGNYYSEIYQGYKYILRSLMEISKEQLVIDPAQDTLIERAFLMAVQFGHSHQELTAGNNEIYDLLHLIPLPFGLNVHSPGVEFLLHLGIKFGATVAFPLVLPFMNSTYTESISPKVKDTAIQLTKFFGINPLEGLHSIKALVPSNTTLSNGLDYISYGKSYHQMRADDNDYKQFMAAYKNWMESIDAVMHARGELSILSNNWHLSSMPLKTSLYLHARMYLYETTNAEEEANEQRIEAKKLAHNDEICTNKIHVHPSQEEISNWGDWIYSGANWAHENKGYLVYNGFKTLNTAYTVYKTVKIILPLVGAFYPNIGGMAHMRAQSTEDPYSNALSLLNNPEQPLEMATKAVIGSVQNEITNTALELVEASLRESSSYDYLGSFYDIKAADELIDNEISNAFNNEASAEFPKDPLVRATSTPLQGDEQYLPIARKSPSSPVRPIKSPLKVLKSYKTSAEEIISIDKDILKESSSVMEAKTTDVNINKVFAWTNKGSWTHKHSSSCCHKAILGENSDSLVSELDI
jgi:hypothetical protein